MERASRQHHIRPMADLVLFVIWAYVTAHAVGFALVLAWMGLPSLGRWLLGLESPSERLECQWREYEAHLRPVAAGAMPRVRDPLTPAEKVRRREVWQNGHPMRGGKVSDCTRVHL